MEADEHATHLRPHLAPALSPTPQLHRAIARLRSLMLAAVAHSSANSMNGQRIAFEFDGWWISSGGQVWVFGVTSPFAKPKFPVRSFSPRNQALPVADS